MAKPASTSKIPALTDRTFAAALKQPGALLVDFWAPWCGPCVQLAPVVDEIAAAHAQLRVVKVDIDKCPKTTLHYDVTAVPTLVLFVDGKETCRIVGAVPKKKIEAKLKPYL